MCSLINRFTKQIYNNQSILIPNILGDASELITLFNGMTPPFHPTTKNG